MNNRGNTIKNVKLIFIAQIVVLAVNIVRTLLIPKIISVEEYGYWQTYLLYVSYISVFFLGFNDGVYLNCVGWQKKDYIDSCFSTSYLFFALILIIEGVIGSVILLFFKPKYYIIYILVAANIPEMGLLGTTSYYYQLTGRIKYYTISTIASKILFVGITIFLWTFKLLSSMSLMWTDIIASFVVLIVIIVLEKDVFIFGKKSIIKGYKNTILFIRNGISVMLGSYVALLFGGIGKMFVQNTCTIEEFSYYSFALSISNIVIVCLGSLGLALYPEIAKDGKESFGEHYNIINRLINVITPYLLIGYYFARLFVKFYLSKYIPALDFLGLSFVTVVLQIKINVLNNTYYKLLRKEKRMLIDNLISLAQMIICCFIFRSGTGILYCQIVVMLFRIYATRYLFAKEIKIDKLNYVFEFLSIAMFLVCLRISFVGIILYTLYVFFFFLFNRKETISYVKMIIGRRKHEKGNII